MSSTDYQRSLIPPAFVRQLDLTVSTANERRLLGLIVRRGGLTQAEIASEIGMSQQSVSRIINSLLERGALAQGEKIVSGKRGQPSFKVEIRPDFAYSFGISIMADAVAVTAMDFSGRVLGEAHRFMPSMAQRDVIPELSAILEQLIERHIPQRQRIFGVGAAISGYFVGSGDRFNTPPALEDWALLEIDELLARAFDLPVWVENDGNAAAIGESMVGVGRWTSNFAYLYVASGLGGGVVVNGELLRGLHGNAGEFAMILPEYEYPHPNLELLRQHLNRAGVQIASVSELVESYDANWLGIDAWIAETQPSWSLIASALAAILDTRAIVLGGRIPRALAQRVIPHIKINGNLRRSLTRPTPDIVAAETSGDAASIGAATLPFKAHFFGAG